MRLEFGKITQTGKDYSFSVCLLPCTNTQQQGEEDTDYIMVENLNINVKY